MRKRTKLVGTIVIAAALAIVPAVSASAASYNGSKVCQGTTYPELTVNAELAGTLTWVNRLNGANVTYAIPGGYSTNFSPYQQSNWTVANSRGFYSAPTAACI